LSNQSIKELGCDQALIKEGLAQVEATHLLKARYFMVSAFACGQKPAPVGSACLEWYVESHDINTIQKNARTADGTQGTQDLQDAHEEPQRTKGFPRTSNGHPRIWVACLHNNIFMNIAVALAVDRDVSNLIVLRILENNWGNGSNECPGFVSWRFVKSGHRAISELQTSMFLDLLISQIIQMYFRFNAKCFSNFSSWIQNKDERWGPFSPALTSYMICFVHFGVFTWKRHSASQKKQRQRKGWSSGTRTS